MSGALSLYELTNEMLPLEAALEAAGGEETEDNKALVQRLEELQLLTQEKVDGYGMYYRTLEALAKSLDEEVARLVARRAAIEHKMARLKDAAKAAMEARGIVKIEGKMFTVFLQRNGGKPPLIIHPPLDSIPDKYWRIRKELDKEKIREDMARGDKEAELIASFEEPGTSVRIR